ncbi:FKBP12-associated protein [Kalmusia sp. IMI 367209]|nr:FKBP12-associated protein [Kalmusia sp. IMI 367209]
MNVGNAAARGNEKLASGSRHVASTDPSTLPYSRKLAVIAAALYSNHLCHAVRSLHLADTSANDQRIVVILKYHTIAMRATRTALYVRFSQRNPAFVEKINSKTSLATSTKSVARKFVEGNWHAGHIDVESNVIDLESAKSHAYRLATRNWASAVILRIKQEAKCNASNNSEGNNKKVLKCDDECSRLQRNQILASALNIDPDRQDDHVPYQADTLNMYQRNSTWAAAQEKILRLFAANPDEKRMRFKPMQRQQRAFIHSLAEDFGLDSESMDPEPHRHVALFKTPRFVMAPMKTLADCVRIRQRERATAATTARTTNSYTLASHPKPNSQPVDPYNGFLLTNPRFALTVEEITTVLRSTMPKTGYPLELEINFLPSEEVSLKPPIAARVSVTEREIESMLQSIKPALSAALASNSMGKLQLVRTDASLNVQRRESDDAPGAGWSQIAKGAPVRRVLQSAPIGTKSGFAVLSLPRKTKKEKVEVADDWEVEEEKEEERERGVSAETSGVNSDAEGAIGEAQGLDITGINIAQDDSDWAA